MTASKQESNRSRITTRLVELIDEISDTQQRALLNMLEDWRSTKRREHPRKMCLVAVDCAAEGRVFKDFISNRSTGGAFVETRAPLPIGQEVTMTFSSPNQEGPIKVRGEVVRSVPEGIGVRFRTPHQHLGTMVESL